MSTTATTVVLARFERHSYDDADFCAIVWDGTRVRVVETGSTRHAGHHNPGPDATAEQDHAARLSLVGPVLQQLAVAETRRLAAPEVGTWARCTSSHGCNRGVAGVVLRLTEVSFHGRARRRALLAVNGDQRWIDADRLMRVAVPPLDKTALMQRARRLADSRGWLELLPLAGI